jgi:hypothetical protein
MKLYSILRRKKLFNHFIDHSQISAFTLRPAFLYYLPIKLYPMAFSRGKILAFAVYLVAVAALLSAVALVERQILVHTERNLILPQDQSFINISTGKTLAFNGVWGLSRHAFQPAASSLLYPILLVPFFFIAGAHLIIPLLLNVIFAVLLLRVLQKELIRRDLSPGSQLMALLVFIFFIPLPLLVVSGMEYTLFLLLMALFSISFFKTSEQTRAIYIYAFLLTATRYEGFLIITAACIQLLYSHRRSQALKLGLAGILPVLLFGLVSLSKGGRLIPPAMLQPYGAGVYTAAILGCLLSVLLIKAPLLNKRQWLASSLFGVIAVIRTTSLLGDIVRSSGELYHEQIQVARFLHRYYPWEGITLNEMGALSWFTDGPKVDLTGLSSYSVLLGQRRHYASPLSSDSLSWWAYAHLAILSGRHASVRPAGHWDEIVTWNIAGNRIKFYSLDTANGRLLRLHMQEYEHGLPADVRVSYQRNNP